MKKLLILFFLIAIVVIGTSAKKSTNKGELKASIEYVDGKSESGIIKLRKWDASLYGLGAKVRFKKEGTEEWVKIRISEVDQLKMESLSGTKVTYSYRNVHRVSKGEVKDKGYRLCSLEKWSSDNAVLAFKVEPQYNPLKDEFVMTFIDYGELVFYRKGSKDGYHIARFRPSKSDKKTLNIIKADKEYDIMFKTVFGEDCPAFYAKISSDDVSVKNPQEFLDVYESTCYSE